MLDRKAHCVTKESLLDGDHGCEEVEADQHGLPLLAASQDPSQSSLSSLTHSVGCVLQATLLSPDRTWL